MFLEVFRKQSKQVEATQSSISPAQLRGRKLSANVEGTTGNGEKFFNLNISGSIEKTGNDSVVIDDIGTFSSPKEGIVISKFELFGEDGELYAMRKMPKHLSIVFTAAMTLTIQLRLTVGKECLGKD